MKRTLSIVATLLMCCTLQTWAVTYVYFENSTSQNFTVSSTQTGTHTLESDEWWSSSSPIADWRDESNVLWVNRDQGIHWGDDFYMTTTVSCADFSVDLELKLHGDFVGSTIWSAASGPGWSHGWSSDNNFHSEIFSVNGTQYQLKYTFYFTGGNDDILFTLHEYDAFSADAAELADPDVVNVLAYNTYMLTPPIALSDQGTRAQHIDEAVHDLDAILIQEVFDNSARATLLAQLAPEYPYQTAVVDLPNILEDGGIMIVSRWPIEVEQQMIWNDCNTPDCLANKGVMYARINKLGRKYHLFSTHQQAFNGNDDVAVRNLQMQQFNAFIDAQNIPADEAVIFGGDMNVDMHTNKLGEYDNMLSIFNSSAPTYIGHSYSWDKYTNHYIDGGAEAPEYLDYVLADNDYLAPITQSNEVWIMRSNHNDMWNIHDLSDHHAILGRFTYPTVVDPCAGVTVSVSSAIVDETYAGANDGSIDITVSGGNSPYTFSWSNGSSAEDLSGLAPGVYTVEVTDNDGCTGNGNGTVSTSTNCTAASASFPSNPLTHSGGGSASTSVSLPAGSFNASLDISGINQVTSGKKNKKYIEQVIVTYVDGNGSNQTYGTYSGASTSSASINITGAIQSITVQLQDIFDGSTASTMNVSMTAVDFCAGPACDDADGDGVCDVDDACPGLDDALIGTACNDGVDCTENDIYDGNCNCAGTPSGDSDGDGVCDALDICPGGDDNVDTDGDGTPDFCDGNCSPASTSFPSNPLTHIGSGSSSTTLNMSAGSVDVDFTISNIGSKVNGKGSGRYIDLVTVTYVDGGGSNQTYGTFQATGTANISIAGGVQSVTVALEDAYDGNAGKNMSVDFTSVSYCSPSARVIAVDGQADNNFKRIIELYPNPVVNTLYIKNVAWKEGSAALTVHALDGRNVMSRIMVMSEGQLDVSSLPDGIYILQIADAAGSVEAFKFIKQ